MRYSWAFAAAFVAACFVSTGPAAQAQVSVEIGPAPVCPYGYYDYAPYACAPYGYYGPEWFTGGVFIGAGPWYHGRPDFHGHVDNHFDPHHGYHGAMPQRGEHAVEHPHAAFHGNEARDGRGHVVDEHGHPR
ncbi:MAG: hypothetical protein WB524_03860 [Acidobacteriaceae bacterium]|jgi:hypothetical protein